MSHMLLMRHKYIDMEYNKLEDHIANVLRQDEAEIDIQAFIQDLHPKKNRRFPAWMWISGLLVIGLIGGGIYLTSHDVTQINSGIAIDTKIQNDAASYDRPLSKTATQLSSDNIKKSELSNTISAIEENSPKKSSKSIVHAENHRRFVNTNDSKNKKSNSYLKEKVIVSSMTQNEDIGKNSLSNSIPANNQSFENQDNYSNNKNLISIAPLAFAHENLSSAVLGKIKTGNVICPTFRKKGRFTLDIIPEIGYFRPLKNLQYDVNEPNNIYDLRHQHESTLEGLNAGLYVRLMNDKLPVFFQAGASFSRMSEKMPLDYAYTKRDTTRGIISITQSQSGDTVTVIYGDIIHENKISGRKTSHHHFTLIDVPVSLGFEKSFGSWSAGIEGGIVLNLAMKASGQILASDTSFTAIDQPIEAYKSRLGLSYFGGLFASRPVGNTGKVFFTIRGRYIPDSFSSDYNRIRQSYHIVGLNVGYIYTLR